MLLKNYVVWMVLLLFVACGWLSKSYGRVRPQSTKAVVAESNVPEELSQQVVEIFKDNCTLIGCHSGSDPRRELKLTKEAYLSTTVNQPSIDKPELMRVDPGKPDSSYLVMKIRGAENIKGVRMPFGRDPLAESKIDIIVEWINQLGPDTRVSEPQQFPVFPFNGWKVVNIPTTRTVESGRWYFLIGHRFLPKIEQGYDAFYGLNGSANIFLNVGYAFTDRFYVNMGRSNVNDNVEMNARYRFLAQSKDDKIPVSAAAQFSVNWISEKRRNKDRLRTETLKYSWQASISRQIREGLSVIVVPGLLFNPNSETASEEPLVTIGLGGKVDVYKTIALVGEWSPMVSGYTLTSTFGNYNRFDTWAAGMEITVGGHVFHIVVTNSSGLTTDQYMRGGDLDIRKGDLRLGFNIFRILNF